MALSDFLLNLRTAAMFLAPKLDFDDPQLDTDYFQDTLAKADIWLTPRAVEGFDVSDFTFLEPGQREALKRNVEAFEEVARQVPGNEPATDEQVRRASESFLRILSIVRPYLDREWRRVYDSLTSIEFPPEVVGFFPEVSPDLTGEPTIWVWVTVDDAVLGPSNLVPLTRRLESLIEGALRDARIDSPVYVGLRARSEMPEVIGTDVE